MTQTQEDWLDQIRGVLAQRAEIGETGMTVREICERTGKNIQVVREVLRQQIAAGRVLVGRGSRPDISGRFQRIPVYSIVREEVK